MYNYKYKFQHSNFVHYREFNEEKPAELNYTWEIIDIDKLSYEYVYTYNLVVMVI